MLGSFHCLTIFRYFRKEKGKAISPRYENKCYSPRMKNLYEVITALKMDQELIKIRDALASDVFRFIMMEDGWRAYSRYLDDPALIWPE